MDIQEQVNSFRELKKLVEDYKQEIQGLKSELELIRNENGRLKQLIITSDIEDVGQAGITDEESICRKQIGLLHELSKVRELTFEETKKYDLYVKNLKLLTDKTKDDSTAMKALSNDELLRLISGKV